LKEVIATHQASLDEVREKIVSSLKLEKSQQMAQEKANELSKRTKAGEKFDAAAKALGLEAKMSEDFSRAGSISGVGSGKQLSAAFAMKTGDISPAQNLGSNWLIYRVESKTEPNPADFDKQKKDLADQVLNEKRGLAYEAFRTALEQRLKQEGKLKIMPEKLRGFGDLT
jgi:hypothetical protein